MSVRPLIEFKIGDQDYRATPMNALVASEVARKMIPLVSGSFAVIISLLKGSIQKGEKFDMSKLLDMDLVTAAGPIAEALAAMPDDRAIYVRNACLGVVQRKSGDGWAAVLANGHLMFEDIGVFDIYKMIGKILERELLPFS